MLRVQRSLLLSVLLLASFDADAEWLQWAGPAGDFTVEVSGLAESWPAEGPEILWKRPLGEGYSSILSKGDSLYTSYRDGENEVVVSLDARTGVTTWAHR